MAGRDAVIFLRASSQARFHHLLIEAFIIVTPFSEETSVRRRCLARKFNSSSPGIYTRDAKTQPPSGLK